MEEKNVPSYKKIAKAIPSDFNQVNVYNNPIVSPRERQKLLAGEASIPARLPHLLLIEDNFVALKILETLVGQLAYEYSSVTNAEEALMLNNALEFDLIITDIGLPGMSGLEFIREVRAQELPANKKPVSVIALSAHASKQTMAECKEAGINQFFIKPVPPNLLKSVIVDFVRAEQAT